MRRMNAECRPRWASRTIVRWARDWIGPIKVICLKPGEASSEAKVKHAEMSGHTGLFHKYLHLQIHLVMARPSKAQACSYTSTERPCCFKRLQIHRATQPCHRPSERSTGTASTDIVHHQRRGSNMRTTSLELRCIEEHALTSRVPQDVIAA